MGFSTKVKFTINSVEYIGRICEVLKNDKFRVVTTGKNGRLWTLDKSQLTLA